MDTGEAAPKDKVFKVVFVLDGPLGITIRQTEINSQRRLVIDTVMPGKHADVKGLQLGDIILQVNMLDVQGIELKHVQSLLGARPVQMQLLREASAQ